MKGFFAESAVETEAPVSHQAKCGACGFYKLCESPKMKPYGNWSARVLVLGEAPGETEDSEDRPFVGKAGLRLRETLDELDLSLDEDALTTNSLICRPRDNATPKDNHLNYCRPNLLQTIEKQKPRVVITLGHTALKTILKDYWKSADSLERWVGWQIPCEDFWICPTYHPSYLLRMNSTTLDDLFKSHLQAAFSITRDPRKLPDFKKHIEIEFNPRLVTAALRDFDRAGGFIAFDYETNCLKPEYPEAAIYSCAVSDGKRTIAYKWKGEAVESTSRLLRSKRTRKIVSNIRMEERWTRLKLGHPVRNWGWDTMLAAHCLDNRPGICGLKFQAWVRLGIPAYNDKVEPYLFGRGASWYNRIEQIPILDLLTYNGLDSLFEYRLAMKQRRDMGL